MSFGGTIKLTGESDYRKALQQITSELNVMSSEMKLVTSQYASNSSSVEALSSKNEVLYKKMQEQTSAVNLCKNAVADFTTQQTKAKSKLEELESVYSDQKTKLDNMKNSTSTSSQELEEQEKIVYSLAQEISKASSEYNSNTTQINAWQIKLNKAETEVNNLKNSIDNNNTSMKNIDDGDNLDEFSDSAGKAESSALSLGNIIKANLISDAIVGGIGLLKDAMVQVGEACIEIGKDAVASFSDYEQLIGGVETLFGESADIVEEYANNAYQTAGLSANEYMETVTSFSASLLQSLDGDTVAAAGVADMAITDMSDNANKMGTSIEDIQNAYQGFAKDNYTMLDNLKLGYGGTQTEMERLLSDASELSGVEYDIGNLDNVYDAIHVVQTEMGITGTTALESSSTISGSLSSLSSSWQNVLTGMSDGDADLSGLTNSLTESVMTFAENIIPVIETIIGNVGELITTASTTLVPQLVEMGVNAIISIADGLKQDLPIILESATTIINTLIEGITTILPELMPIAVDVLLTLVDAVISNLPLILQTGITMLLQLINGISEALPELIPTIVESVILIVETLIDNIDLIIDAGIDIIFGLIDGLILALPTLIDKMPELIDKLIIAITDNLPKIIDAGITLTLKIAEGLIKAIPQLVSKIPEIIVSFINGINNYRSNMSDVGKNLIEGMWEGISNVTQWLKDKISGFASGITDSIKSFFGIHSPSTLFKEEIGTNLALGVGEGFSDSMKSVTEEMQDALPTSFNTEVDALLNTSNLNSVGTTGLNSAIPQIIFNVQELDKDRLEQCFNYVNERFGLAY